MRGCVAKCIMIRGARLAFSISHNLVILIVAQFLVSLMVFHIVDFLIFLICYNLGLMPPLTSLCLQGYPPLETRIVLHYSVKCTDILATSVYN